MPSSPDTKVASESTLFSSKFGTVRHVIAPIAGGPPGAAVGPTPGAATMSSSIRESWIANLPSRAEDAPGWPNRGLRRPQLGAIQAVLGFWSTGSDSPATVVLPTGSGKTETMLTLLAIAKFQRLLIVVPTDALRLQIADKFETFGLLRSRGVLAKDAINPRVGRLTGGAKSAPEALAFASEADVIVATPNSLNACSIDARTALSEACSAVFFDEAHHIRARTWSEIRDMFADKPIVQFTATPFREDNRAVDGRFVYVFPLREAQKDKIYGTVRYQSVFDLQDPDTAIASAAIDVLTKDIEANFDHVLMARCDTRKKAEELYELYSGLAAQFSPVLLHAGLGERKKRAALDALTQRDSRIVVCVDMLGEGFDMPELKVAAFHAPKRSLAPTLQLVGRFARVADHVGDATVVAARSERLLDRRISRLYGEDSDWNLIIDELTTDAVAAEEAVSEFEAGFGGGATTATTRLVAPKMSAVVFRTKCDDWDPHAISDLIEPDDLLTDPLPINVAARVAWFVIRSRSQVEWIESQLIENVTHTLFVVHWDAARGLLFINHSANEGVFHDLARALCGDDVELITGDLVYRSMGEIDRAIPTNVGVLDIFNNAKRFSMFAGADVSEGFSDGEEATKVQTNIFVVGYRDGDRATMGASLKGRMWSYQAAMNILDWVSWCEDLGRRLLDESIDVAAIRRKFIKPKVLEAWPELPVLALEFPTSLLMNNSEVFRVRAGQLEAHVFDLDVRLDNPGVPDPHVRFTIEADDFEASYELRITANGMTVVSRGDEIVFDSGRRQITGAEYLTTSGMLALMGNDALISPPGILLQPQRELQPFDRQKILKRDWGSTNLRKESRGQERDEATVQGVILTSVLKDNWDVVIDDDGSGEIADLVALRRDDSTLHVAFFHCKFAIDGKTGARVADLYELCGQAQKSGAWRRDPQAMLQKLVRRERSRLNRKRKSGLERGTVEDLVDLIQDLPLLRTKLSVTIVQPALTQAGVSPEQLQLLGSTETYLREISSATFSVVGNANA